ncbi:extensin family protein, partial [Raoultella ornithinolytica]|uniref:extensin family protein n=1 Tax=Raoultella ornithinolytica TaxID=54291 RepID=UPI0013DC1923
ADGTRIGVLEDWEAGGEKAAFLREVRTGACRLFSTVLSPDYNAAHRDHLHLDEAKQGELGWRACR